MSNLIYNLEEIVNKQQRKGITTGLIALSKARLKELKRNSSILLERRETGEVYFNNFKIIGE